MKAKVTREPSGSIRIGRVGKEIQTYRAQRVILAIGQVMESAQLPSGIETLEGRIAVDAFGRTNHPKFFAGGDVSGGKAFVADAVAGGKMAALSMACYLENRPVEEVFNSLRIGTGRSFSFQHFMNPQSARGDLSKAVSFEQVNSLFFTKSARVESEKVNAFVRRARFQEVSPGMDSSAADRELWRCFRCGTCTECNTCMDFCPDVSLSKNASSKGYSFDQDHCKGCGVCAVACPRSVIEMVREAT
jgi:Pyruvate/2-oxoacid:ferredoxin oxidoreductase delta subunit